MTARSKWKCPSCGAPVGKCGKGGKSACQHGGVCEGLLCDCDEYGGGMTHGETVEDPCRNAICQHCGWCGEMPVVAFDPKTLKGWAKQAYAAGWRPPTGWTP